MHHVLTIGANRPRGVTWKRFPGSSTPFNHQLDVEHRIVAKVIHRGTLNTSMPVMPQRSQGAQFWDSNLNLGSPARLCLDLKF
jgi:hypothetical protein